MHDAAKVCADRRDRVHDAFVVSIGGNLRSVHLDDGPSPLPSEEIEVESPRARWPPIRCLGKLTPCQMNLTTAAKGFMTLGLYSPAMSGFVSLGFKA